MIFKNFKWIWVILALAVVVWCISCSESDESPTSEQGGVPSHATGKPAGEDGGLKRLLPEEAYDTMTEKSRDSQLWREANRDKFDPPLSELPNGQWYLIHTINGSTEWHN